MASIQAVLFDIDGTLVDSNDAHARAWVDALRGHGKQVPYDLVRSRIGMGGDKLLMELAGIDSDSTEGRLLTERRVSLFKAFYLPDLGPLPGGRSLISRLQTRGFVCAAVTSAAAAEVADLLRQAAVADLLGTIINADDAEDSKPDPDLVHAALDRLAVGPRQAVMIGDTPYDIAAAARAGVSTIALRSGGWKDPDLDGAIAIYDHPADLLAHLDASPIMLGVDDEMPPASAVRRGRGRRAAIPRPA